MPLIDNLHELVTDRVGSRPLGVARVLVGIALLLNATEVTFLLGLWIYSPTRLRTPYFAGVPSLPELLFVPFVFLLFLSAFAFLIGYGTRAAGTTSVLLMSYIVVLDQQFFSNHLYLVLVLCLLFTIGDCGAAFSVDARRGHGKAEVARWPVTLLKLTLTIVYTLAVISKINPVFLAGVPYERYLLRSSIVSIPGTWRSAQLMTMLAVGTIIMEALIVLGLWSRRYRPWAFFAGFMLHTSIPLIMPAVPAWLLGFSTIGISMLAPYLLFLEATPASRVVILHEGRRGVAWLSSVQRLDWLGVHRFLSGGDAAVPGGASVKSQGPAVRLSHAGVTVSGFDAVRYVLEGLPVSFLWAPALRLPPLRWFGERVYRLTVARG